MKRKKKNPMVRIWDRATNTFPEIPKAELGPGMVSIRLSGEGNVWVRQQDLDDMHGQGYQHPPFNQEMRGYVAEIKSAFDPYLPKTAEEWEDGFRRDADAEMEIALWLFSADKMKKHAPGPPNPRNQEVYKLLVLAMMNGADGARLTFEGELLTKADIEMILGPESD